ncbi:MAG: adenosylmethionine decarboxylase [Nanoarchaeota archaeon]
MEYESSPVGNEISCVMHGVPKKILLDNNFLEKSLLYALKIDKFTILKVFRHQFKPQGLTILVLLSESHAAIHTYPEHDSLYFSIYTCRGEFDGKNVFENLKKSFRTASVDIAERPIVVSPAINFVKA